MRGVCPSGRACLTYVEARARAQKRRRRLTDRTVEYRCRNGCTWWHIGQEAEGRRKVGKPQQRGRFRLLRG